MEYRSGWMEGDRYVEADPYFEVQPVLAAAVVPQRLAAISHHAVNEQISKANKRIAAGDFAGAIASGYTLTEHLLKLILREERNSFSENEGDIRALYKLVREPLKLNPAGESIAAPLKPILDGFQKLVSGLYEISNKASDRHARRYNTGCASRQTGGQRRVRPLRVPGGITRLPERSGCAVNRGRCPGGAGMTNRWANHDDTGTGDVFHALHAGLTVELIATQTSPIHDLCSP